MWLRQRRRRTEPRRAPRVPAIAQHAGGQAQAGEATLRFIRKIADLDHELIWVTVGDGVSDVEQYPIAFRDACDFGLRIKARRRCAVLVPCVRSGTEQDAQSVLLRANTPFDVFPVKRVIAATGARIGAQRRGAKQACTSACAQVPAGGFLITRLGMEHLHAAPVDVPIGETRFLASAGCALLMYLTSNRKHVRGSQCANFAQRQWVERHVVVHQERPIVLDVLESLVNRGAEAQRGEMMHQSKVGIHRDDFVVNVSCRAVGNDHDLVWLVDRIKRLVEGLQRLEQKGGRVALGNHDRDARAPSRKVTPRFARAQGSPDPIGRQEGKEKRRQAQALAKPCAPGASRLARNRAYAVSSDRVSAKKIGSAQTRYRRRSAESGSSGGHPVANSACSANIAVQQLYCPGSSEGEKGMPNSGSI